MNGGKVPSHAEIAERLCAPGQFFEMETVEVSGIATRVWRHAPRCLPDVLKQGSSSGGDRDFIRLGDERLTHAEHYTQVTALATRLRDELGVAKGDCVAIAMRNLPEWSIAFFAATMIGAVAVPLNAMWKGAEMAFAITDCKASVLIADGERLERLAPHVAELPHVKIIGTRLDDRKGSGELPAGITSLAALTDGVRATRPEVDIAPDDHATIFYTSGTTGLPRGVLGTHRNICTNLISMMYSGAAQMLRAGIEPGAVAPAPSVVLVPVPLFHATGCHSILLAQAFFGGTLVFMRKWDPERALDLVEEHGVTLLSGVPSMVWDLVNSPTAQNRDLRTLTNLGAGGAASPRELVRRVDELLPGRMTSAGYGLTETSSMTASNGGADYLLCPESVGVPIPVCDVRIVDGTGTDLPPGEPGEIWIKGPNVVPGYWHRPEETASTFTEGWLHSGDIGRIDEQGRLFIVDRAKDIIIRGGENISSLEVESALYQHPAVLEAAVFAAPHATLGEEVAAVLRLRPGHTVSRAELREFLLGLLAPFKVPAHIWFVEESMPRSPSGKLLKRELRRRFVAEPAKAGGA
jgi:acyl-CoA synthetase (AMP-forming)/AMP-acid ligase II